MDENIKVYKVLYPAPDTENINCDCDLDISVKDMNKMIDEHFYENDAMITRYTNQMMGGYSDPYVSDMRTIQNNQQRMDYHDSNYIEVPMDTYIIGLNDIELEENQIMDKVYDGQMFAIKLNINPETIDDRIISDLKFWVRDSNMLWNNPTLSQEKKLLMSPTRNLKIELSDKHIYTMKNCKIFESYITKKHPFFLCNFS